MEREQKTAKAATLFPLRRQVSCPCPLGWLDAPQPSRRRTMRQWQTQVSLSSTPFDLGETMGPDGGRGAVLRVERDAAALADRPAGCFVDLLICAREATHAREHLMSQRVASARGVGARARALRARAVDVG